MSNKLNENIDTWNKKPSKSILLEAQNNFVESSLENDINFFDNLQSADIFSSFQKFLNSKDKFKEFSLTLAWYTQDQKDILVEQIEAEKMKILFMRKNSLSQLSKIYLNEYKNLDAVELDKKLAKKSIVELANLLKSDENRRKFLKESKLFSSSDEVLKNKLVDEENLLKNINIKAEDLKKLDSEQKDRLSYLFNEYKKIEFSDLEGILSVLDKDSKENLLKYFLKQISIEDLEKIWLLSLNLKDSILKSIETLSWASVKEAKNIYSSMDKSKIFVDISDLGKIDLSKILENDSQKKRILDEYNSEVSEDEIKGKEKFKLDKDWNIYENFLKTLKNDENISEDIKSKLEKFKEGNFIEISWKGKNGYYKIKKFDNWNTLSTKSILLENLTAEGWMKKLWTWNDENHLYSNFYKMLEKISNKENWLEIKFYDSEDLKKAKVTEVLEEAWEIDNYEDLLKWLDSIDPEWKDFWLDSEKTTIYDKKENFVFLIKEIDKNKKEIKIDEGNKEIKVSFRDFYANMKKKKEEYKRAKKINSYSELSLAFPEFSGIEIKNNAFIDKKNDKEGKNPIKYFVAWKEAIYVDKISENSITYYTWEIKEEVKKWKKFKSKYRTKNFSQFYQDIKLKKMVPMKKDEVSQENIKKMHEKGSFLSKYLSGLSISDIVYSVNYIIDKVKARLERWNKLKSLKFAEKIWKVLWKNMLSDLQSSVESEEKKLIDEIKSSLQVLNAKEQFEQIIRILENKNSEQYEVIGAMMATVKYWNLYPKDLATYNWSYLWYKKLGWTEEFKRKQLEANEKMRWTSDYRNYTEEDLIVSWLKTNTPKRFRSKLWKDFAVAVWSWNNDEFEWGSNQAWDVNTFDQRYGLFMWFLSGREYAWAVWALVKTLGKNTSPEEMNAAPFALAMSWACNNFSPSLIKKVKDLNEIYPYSTLRYCVIENWDKKYASFIKTLIKDVFKDDKQMLISFEKIEKTADIKSKVSQIQSFWKNYGYEISKYLSFKGNNYLILNRDKFPEYKDFYNESNKMLSDDSYKFQEDPINEWVYSSKNNVWYFLNWLSNLKMSQGWSYGSGMSEFVHKQYMKTLEEIRTSESWTREQKRAIFKQVYEKFEKKVRSEAWMWVTKADPNALFTYEFHRRWLSFANADMTDAEYDKFLDKNFESFMSRQTTTTENTKESTKISIDNILNN